MFTAILPMVERFLSSVKFTDALQCQLESQILDDGDAVALWSGENLKALLFPTGDSLLKAKSLPPTDVKLFVLINPQWQEGQVISDFGFGRRKEDIERFLEDFQYTYFLKQYRIQGLDVRYIDHASHSFSHSYHRLGFCVAIQRIGASLSPMRTAVTPASVNLPTSLLTVPLSRP